MPTSINRQAWTSAGLFASNMFHHIRTELIDLVFPPRCVHCGKVDINWCTNCTELLDQQELVLQHTRLKPEFAVLSTGVHSGVLQSAVQGLKYHALQELALPLGNRLSIALKEQNWTFDTLTAVPLHSDRHQQRGYNQSNELLMVIAEGMSAQILTQGLERTRNTRSQVGLDAQERRENMLEAFKADPSQVADRRIVIIDDVCTTGATMLSCAEALYAAGANAVYGLTVTLAIH